jgi:transcriptional regulator with XRE-family HTH domain
MSPTARTALAAQVGAILARHRGDEPRRELARRLGVADVTLVDVERGTVNPTLARVEALAGQYGARLAIVDVDELIEEVDLILRGKLGVPARVRRNITTRLTTYITAPQEPQP